MDIVAPRGTEVTKGDVWLKVHHSKPISEGQMQRLQDALVLSQEPVAAQSRIIEIISRNPARAKLQV